MLASWPPVRRFFGQVVGVYVGTIADTHHAWCGVPFIPSSSWQPAKTSLRPVRCSPSSETPPPLLSQPSTTTFQITSAIVGRSFRYSFLWLNLCRRPALMQIWKNLGLAVFDATLCPRAWDMRAHAVTAGQQGFTAEA